MSRKGVQEEGLAEGEADQGSNYKHQIGEATGMAMWRP